MTLWLCNLCIILSQRFFVNNRFNLGSIFKNTWLNLCGGFYLSHPPPHLYYRKAPHPGGLDTGAVLLSNVSPVFITRKYLKNLILFITINLKLFPVPGSIYKLTANLLLAGNGTVTKDEFTARWRQVSTKGRGLP